MNHSRTLWHCLRQWALLSHVPRYLQVTAEERISIWSLMLDQEQKSTKEVFVPARSSLEMANIILGNFRSGQRMPPLRDSYELLVMEGGWRPHHSQTEQTVIGAVSIWYWAFNLRSLMQCHLKSLGIPGILRRWHLKSPRFSVSTKYFAGCSNELTDDLPLETSCATKQCS